MRACSGDSKGQVSVSTPGTPRAGCKEFPVAPSPAPLPPAPLFLAAKTPPCLHTVVWGVCHSTCQARVVKTAFKYPFPHA